MPNNNLNILPFYEDKKYWSENQDNAYGQKFCIASPYKQIPPFQIYVENKDEADFGQASFTLIRTETGDETDITSLMFSTGLSAVDKGDDTTVIYRGRLPIGAETPTGEYHLKFSWPAAGPGDTSVLLYSEKFNILRRTDDKLRISYRSLTDIGTIDFTSDTAFKFETYLDTALNTPEYTFEEEGEDRDGFFFVEKQLSEKTYKFNFLAPEFMCDAMRIVPMMDEKEISYNGRDYTVERFLPTPEWQQGGFWAAIAVEFQCDTVIKKIGLAYDLSPQGDYSADFNADYKKDD